MYIPPLRPAGICSLFSTLLMGICLLDMFSSCTKSGHFEVHSVASLRFVIGEIINQAPFFIYCPTCRDFTCSL